MAKQFRFDDEDENMEEEYEQPSHIDELENMREENNDDDSEEEPFELMQDEFVPNEYINLEEELYEDNEENEEEEEEPVSKKKKKFEWKWWHYVLIGLGVLFIIFMVYIFAVTSGDGPVYGDRCEGIETISNDLIKAATEDAKKAHSEIASLDYEIACRQLKVDIVFNDGTSTKKAKSIAEDAVQILDKLVGKSKDEGKTYSNLFGTIDGVTQYEVNLYLKCEDNEDFPIYGTKNVQNDEFSYTLASVKDKDSYEKARETLNDEE